VYHTAPPDESISYNSWTELQNGGIVSAMRGTGPTGEVIF
jgi:hypothetical protein